MLNLFIFKTGKNTYPTFKIYYQFFFILAFSIALSKIFVSFFWLNFNKDIVAIIKICGGNMSNLGMTILIIVILVLSLFKYGGCL